MATYEYKCKECESVVTISRSINDKEEIPVCGACKINMNKVYSMAAPVFKGSGFYRTDK